MKLYNVVTYYDLYILASSHDDARAVSDEIVKTGDQKPYDQVAYEIRQKGDIRNDWRDQTPWVSPSLTDYEPTATDTCITIFERLYSSR